MEHPYFVVGVLLKWVCGVKLVVHSHNWRGRLETMGKWWWRILWVYERWVHRRADYNFFIQDEDMQYAIRPLALDSGALYRHDIRVREARAFPPRRSGRRAGAGCGRSMGSRRRGKSTF